MYLSILFFFFKQKTAYEMRISDWSSDVCSSDLRRLVAMGFEVVATSGAARCCGEHGITVKRANKVMEGRPHIVDDMKNGAIQLVFNTSEGAASIRDSFDLRHTALMNKIPYFTTVAGAKAAVRAIEALRAGSLAVSPLQAYF